jgi:hypothetical protein
MLDNQKNRTQFTRLDKDYTDIVPVIEFCHMNQELKDLCIKLAKQELSKTFLIRLCFES